MKRRNRIMNLLYLPALVIVLMFVLYPLIRSIYISLLNWNGYSPKTTFVGLKNYVQLFSDSNFRTALGNTILYGFGSTLLQNILGLLFAVFLNTKFKGHKIVRTIIYLPVMISGLIMGYIMYFMVQNTGAINEMLSWFGLSGVEWLGSRKVAVWVIVLINSWQYCGIAMVIYMAGLQDIPTMYYEASAIDGANPRQQFFKITMPLLVPAISSGVTLNLIGGLKLYDVVVSLTGGGPGFDTSSLSTYISNRYFSAEQAGYASAVGVVMFILILIVSLISNRHFSKKEIY